MRLEEMLRCHPNGRFSVRTTGVDPDKVRVEIAPEEETFDVYSFYIIGNEAFPVVDLVGEEETV
jgi:hypothetical protein